MPARSTPVFLDSAFLYALVNTHDDWHGRASGWQQRIVTEGRPMLTTEFVLIETGDGLAGVRFRSKVAAILIALQSSPLVEVVPASPGLFVNALSLFRERDDKGWGITDCSSFSVMRERGMEDALTPDRHFQQAGFRALLREAP